jgi:hypothetical protein
METFGAPIMAGVGSTFLRSQLKSSNEMIGEYRQGFGNPLAEHDGQWSLGFVDDADFGVFSFE